MMGSSRAAPGRYRNRFHDRANLAIENRVRQPLANAVFSALLMLGSQQALAGAGELDTSFGNNGWVATELLENTLPPDDQASAVIEQSDGKLVIAGHTQIDGNMDGLLTRYNADGSPDSSFGNNGMVTLAIGSEIDAISAMVRQPDGKLVVAGRTQGNNRRYDFFIARLLEDGNPDVSFGNNGITVTAVSTSTDIANALALQADGKLIAAGYTSGAEGIDFALVRYNSDGTVDSGFADNGIAVHNLAGGAGTDIATGLAIQGDGKILAAGRADTGSDYDFAVARFNTDGSLDSGFGTTGAVLTDMGGINDFGAAVIVQPDGKMVVAGEARDTDNKFKLAVARYNGDGSLDLGFGVAGKQKVLAGPSITRGYDIILLPDGKLAAAAQSYTDSSTTYNFTLIRLNSDGSLDTGFDGDGHAIAPLPRQNLPQKLLRQADGKLVMAGLTSNLQNSTGNDLTVVRFNDDGSLDTGFNSSGSLVSNLGTWSSRASLRGLALQADGKILAAGNAFGGQDEDAVVVRYNNDGSLDTGFADNGISHTDLGITEYLNDLLVQADGKLVATGQLSGSITSLLLRLNSDGSADAGFGTAGAVQTNVSSNGYEIPNAVLQQTDGKLVTVGYSYNGSQARPESMITRHNVDGSLDTSFDSDGIVTTDIGGDYNYYVAVAQQSDNKLLALGYTGTTERQLTLTRYLTDGSLDTSFGAAGIVIDNAGAANTLGVDLAILASGNILVAASTIDANGNQDFTLLSYNADGSPDTSFASNGRITTDFTGGSDNVRDMLVQPDGKILLAGYATNADLSYGIGLARYNPDGSPDYYFGENGTSVIDIASSAYRIALQADGNILVGANATSPARFLVARVLGTSVDSDGDGVPDDHDAFPDNAAATQDDDNDGMPDAWNTDCDNTCQANSGLTLDLLPGDSDNDNVPNDSDDFPNDPTETTDSDGDGVGDNSDAFINNSDASVDDDGDGQPDAWNPACDSSCQDSSSLTLDAYPGDEDNDGIPDDSDDTYGDNNPPEVIAPMDISLVATGDTTTVLLGNASAEDAVDGPLTAVPDTTGNATTVDLAPGRHIITWSATDNATNVGSDTQIVEITPLARFSSPSQTVGEGSTVALTVTLNGDAVTYPVAIPVLIDAGSTATGDDHDAANHIIIIEEDADPANTGTYQFTATDDGLTGEADETVIFTLVTGFGFANDIQNAATDDTAKQHTVTITELNVAPLINNATLSLAGSDGSNDYLFTGTEEEPHTLIRRDQEYTLTANLTDGNPEDSHSYSWMINDALQAEIGATLTLNPIDFEVGEYTISVQALDDANPPEYSNTLAASLTLKNPPPAAVPASSSGGGALHWLWLLAGLMLTPRLRRAQ
ncbi:hypothetical protein MWU49_17490 [Alcanivorax sp. S6407]|uniref:hypothetical protein n=1 Tax=Alcanivorax sp. S6407 TaxID=2926424 RepID=UPI001FF21A21|nr:hypothetical protein [Alcanivorax sp. S6407]MCK0155512.1 hypothetical protein [Alcanivorax sp. S6407]